MHNSRILYYERGNAILEIISYPTIIGVAITSYFAAAGVLVFCYFWCESSTKVSLLFSYSYLVLEFIELSDIDLKTNLLESNRIDYCYYYESILYSIS